jgi:hypothetical protein
VAKVQLKAGAQVDFLTSDEAKAAMDTMRQDLLDYFEDKGGDTQVIAPSSFTLDGSGDTAGADFQDGGYPVYEVSQGFRCYLLRLQIDYEGSNAADLVTCDVRIVADANTPSSLRALNNTLPTAYDSSRSHAALFQGGQKILVSVTGGPESTELYVSGQVLLVPIKARNRTSRDTLIGD